MNGLESFLDRYGLILAGLLVWFLIRRRQRPAAPRSEVIAEAIEDWHVATCPVCLILGSASRSQPITAEARQGG